MRNKIGRNDPCPCGSGKKYKKCCLVNDRLKGTSVNFTWQKIRVTEAKVQNLLQPYVKEKYGVASILEAWQEFTLWQENFHIPLEEPEFESIFMGWFNFNWVPNNDKVDPKKHLPEEKIAMLYMKEHGHKLDPFDKRFIEATCNSEFSFYKVINIVKDQSLTLKDVFSGKNYTIYERQGTNNIECGYITYARIITLDGISIQFGMAPYLIPPTYGINFVDFKEDLLKKSVEIDGNLYHNYAFELREMYWAIRNALCTPREMKLTNTDGDPISLTKLTYKLECSIDEAFDKLRKLSWGNTKKELLQKAEVHANGKLKYIQFSWLKKGNKTHESWENTIMGNITLDDKSFTVEVNSEKRSKKVQERIEKLLGDKVKLQHKTIESLEKNLEKTRDEPEDTKKKQEIDDLNKTPEVQALLRKMMKSHWEKWLDMKIPALKNQTPRQAAKTEFGRERLEALFTEFELKSIKTPEPHLKAPVSELRSKLGI